MSPQMSKVAIVGAGLAGLSSAYHLRNKAKVVLLEKTNRIGGRIFSCSTPQGEHGGEFFLGEKSEPLIHDLLKKLHVKKSKEISDWPGYYFNGQFVCGSPERAAKKLLPSQSSKLISQLCHLANSSSYPKTKILFNRWLSQRLKFDTPSMAFIDMILKGDACAPMSHISVKYALGCLSAMYDSWFRIKNGSQTLVDALLEGSKATVRRNTWIKAIHKTKTGIQVKGLTRGKSFSNEFEAVIITTPEGESLVGKSTNRHFHKYISILIEYPFRPKLKSKPAFDLSRGLYTDSIFNYLQVRHMAKSRYVLRILIPVVSEPSQASRKTIKKKCLEFLDSILQKAKQFRTFNVMSWETGLPCGDNPGVKFPCLECSGILLCGDRFGKWPSMEAAISSGLQAAKVLKRRFRDKT